jgi:hypothetical protein
MGLYKGPLGVELHSAPTLCFSSFLHIITVGVLAYLDLVDVTVFLSGIWKNGMSYRRTLEDIPPEHITGSR